MSLRGTKQSRTLLGGYPQFAIATLCSQWHGGISMSWVAVKFREILKKPASRP